jgi:hypothetical protein
MYILLQVYNKNHSAVLGKGHTVTFIKSSKRSKRTTIRDGDIVILKSGGKHLSSSIFCSQLSWLSPGENNGRMIDEFRVEMERSEHLFLNLRFRLASVRWNGYHVGANISSTGTDTDAALPLLLSAVSPQFIAAMFHVVAIDGDDCNGLCTESASAELCQPPLTLNPHGLRTERTSEILPLAAASHNPQHPTAQGWQLGPPQAHRNVSVETSDFKTSLPTNLTNLSPPPMR